MWVMNQTPVRIDKWLWAARLVKTRALAVDAIRGGRVKVNGQPAKPSKDVRPGDRLEFNAGVIRLEAIVKRHRGAATARFRRGPALRGDRGEPDRARAAGRGDAHDPAAGRGPQRAADQARAPASSTSSRAAHGGSVTPARRTRNQ